MFKTAGCLAHWNNAQSRGARRIVRSHAIADPSRIRPGMIFIMDFGGRASVYRLHRKIAEVNKGFIDYAGL